MPAVWTPPAIIDGLHVVRPLGQGGMGTVYLAHDPLLDRPTALKLISRPDQDERMHARFLTEARALARLQHPNVVGVYRFGEVEGRPYLAYEFVEGTSLDALPRPVPWPRALSLAIGLARGIAAAHERGVVHRDIKPANIMVTANGEVKLLDFGLARLSDTEPTPAHSSGSGYAATHGGRIAGTPVYMAPERWLGTPPDPGGDVWSFGAVIWELLTGKHPLREVPMSSIPSVVLYRNFPSVLDHAPEVPPALASLIERFLTRDPAARPRTGAEARDALEALGQVLGPGPADPGADPGVADVAAAVLLSFSRLSPVVSGLAAEFYRRLFLSHPELRNMFPAEMAGQQDRFTAVLQVIVQELRNPTVLVPVLRDLGRRHAAYGVKPAHFDVVGAVLLETLAALDPGWSPAVAEAWTTAWGRVARTVLLGLQEASQPSTGGAPAPTYQGTGTMDASFAPPRTRFARHGGATLAWQSFGPTDRDSQTSAIDLVYCPGWVNHIEMMWDNPRYAAFLVELSSLARVVVYDRRGTGLSDRPFDQISAQDRIDDLRAVLDAAEVHHAVCLGVLDGLAPCVGLAVQAPARVSGLVAWGAADRADPRALDAAAREVETHWGDPLFLDLWAPSLARDRHFRKWWASYLRNGASPAAAAALLRASGLIDLSALLPALRVPMMVLHRAHDRVTPPSRAASLVAALPPTAVPRHAPQQLVLPGEDHLPFVGDTAPLFSALRTFLRGLEQPTPHPPLQFVVHSEAQPAHRYARVSAAVDAAFGLDAPAWIGPDGAQPPGTLGPGVTAHPLVAALLVGGPLVQTPTLDGVRLGR